MHVDTALRVATPKCGFMQYCPPISHNFSEVAEFQVLWGFFLFVEKKEDKWFLHSLRHDVPDVTRGVDERELLHGHPVLSASRPQCVPEEQIWKPDVLVVVLDQTDFIVQTRQTLILPRLSDVERHFYGLKKVIHVQVGPALFVMRLIRIPASFEVHNANLALFKNRLIWKNHLVLLFRIMREALVCNSGVAQIFENIRAEFSWKRIGSECMASLIGNVIWCFDIYLFFGYLKLVHVESNPDICDSWSERKTRHEKCHTITKPHKNRTNTELTFWNPTEFWGKAKQMLLSHQFCHLHVSLPAGGSFL